MRTRDAVNRVQNGNFAHGLTGWINETVQPYSLSSTAYYAHGTTTSGLNNGSPYYYMELFNTAVYQTIAFDDLWAYPTVFTATSCAVYPQSPTVYSVHASTGTFKTTIDNVSVQVEPCSLVEAYDQYNSSGTGRYRSGVVGSTGSWIEISPMTGNILTVDSSDEYDDPLTYYSRTGIVNVHFNDYVGASSWVGQYFIADKPYGYGVISSWNYDADSKRTTATLNSFDGFPTADNRVINKWYVASTTCVNMNYTLPVISLNLTLTYKLSGTATISIRKVYADGSTASITPTAVRSYVDDGWTQHVCLITDTVTSRPERIDIKIDATSLVRITDVQLLRGDYTAEYTDPNTQYDLLLYPAEYDALPKGLIVPFTGNHCPAGWKTIPGAPDDTGYDMLVEMPITIEAAIYDTNMDQTLLSCDCSLRTNGALWYENGPNSEWVPGDQIVLMTDSTVSAMMIDHLIPTSVIPPPTPPTCFTVTMVVKGYPTLGLTMPVNNYNFRVQWADDPDGTDLENVNWPNSIDTTSTPGYTIMVFNSFTSVHNPTLSVQALYLRLEYYQTVYNSVPYHVTSMSIPSTGVAQDTNQLIVVLGDWSSVSTTGKTVYFYRAGYLRTGVPAYVYDEPHTHKSAVSTDLRRYDDSAGAYTTDKRGLDTYYQHTHAWDAEYVYVRPVGRPVILCQKV